jgi:hypothetical protein
MAITLYTKAWETATVTITNGGANSDAKKLKWRDLDVYGLNVAAGSSLVTIKYDLGSATDIRYILLMNTTSSAAVDLTDWDYSDNDADWTEIDSFETQTYTNSNIIFTTPSTNEHRYFRVTFDRTTNSPTLTMSCIFMGISYTAPVNYQYNNGLYTRQRTEVQTDIRGYPYGQAMNTTNQKIWDITFNMTSAQLTLLLAELTNVNFNCRPFVVKDTNIDSTYRLVRYPYDSLDATNLSYDFYEVPLSLEEL